MATALVSSLQQHDTVDDVVTRRAHQTVGLLTLSGGMSKVSIEDLQVG
jgi:hypothetical protein